MTAAPILPPSGQPLIPDGPIAEGIRTLNRVLDLIEKGYHVFPVRVQIDPATGANTKTYVTGRAQSPTGAKWNATRDADLVQTWWGPGARFNDCMIGIATEPSGVVLADLDVKPHRQADGTMAVQDGPAEWRKLVPQRYPFPAAIGTSSTGGKHLPYRANPRRPVKTGTGDLAPGVDTRGVGGMFVCWSPWLPKVSELPMVPDVVPDRAPYAERKVSAPVSLDPSQFAVAGDVQARVLALRDQLADVPEGQGDATVKDLAFRVGQYVGAGQVDQGWATAVMLSAVEGWTWTRPEDERKIRDKIVSKIELGMTSPRPWVAEPPALATASTLTPPMTAPAYLAPVTPLVAPTGRLTATAALTVETSGGLDGELDGDLDDGSDYEADGVSAEVHPGRRVVLTSVADIKVRRARWLWDGRVAVGTLALVAGKQGLGKSTVVYELVAQLTRGALAGEFYGTPRAVLICATEDSWECTIKPRLVAADADVTLVFRVEAVRADGIADGLVLPADVHAVEQAALAVDAALLVLDPLTSRLDAVLDGHRDGPVRQALEPLVAMTGRVGMTSLGLMHLNKGSKADPMDAVLGATAFTAVARSVLIVMPDPDDEERRRKLIGLAKNNLGRLDLPTLVFRTVTALVPTDDPEDERPAEVGRIEWLGQAEGSIADAMEAASQDDETRTGIADSVRWLKDHLSHCGGEADSMSIKEAARKAGFNERMVTRARKRAGIIVATIPNSFPRRTTWSFKDKRSLRVDTTPAWGAIDAVASSTDTSLLTKNTVTNVFTVSTRSDSQDGSDGSTGVDSGVSITDPSPRPTPAAALDPMAGMPPWAAEPAPADAAAGITGDAARDAPPPCPCGRAERLHSRGNWRTCPADHRWHAFGHGALGSCPQCPAPAGTSDGGDAA